MRARSRTLLLCLITLLANVAPAAASLGVPGTVTASAAPAAARYGATVQVSGALETEEVCRSGRGVTIEFRSGDGAPWNGVGSGLTGSTGSYAVAVAADRSGEYRAVVPSSERETASCDEASSAPVPVTVRAAVTAFLDRPRLAAGTCATLTVTVQPPKPGTDVIVERRTGEGWVELDAVTLDDASRATMSRCHGWSAIGTSYRLRGRWGGDDAHVAAASPGVELTVVKARWMRRIDRALRGSGMSVSVRNDNAYLYRRNDTASRVPASNEKLLLSMALLEAMGPDARMRVVAGATSFADGSVGNLWILGEGDPSVSRDTLELLAARLDDAGVERITGRIRGSTTPFAHDWFAPGWKRSFPRDYVALPTALTYRGNQVDGRHISDPERRAARALTRILEERGIPVAGSPGMGTPPAALTEVAEVSSPTVATLLTGTNRSSSNFFAEVLGKRLGMERSGPPGTIARGAAAIEAWASANGVGVNANDASGLSYDNRVTASGLARLLSKAEATSWGTALRASLAAAGQGTLAHRLDGVQLRAKTGTLTDISALSGFVWLERTSTWAEFSILSRGLSKTKAVQLEDRVASILHSSAR